MSATPSRLRSLCPYVAWGLRSSSLAGAEASGKNNYLIRPIGSRQPRLEAGEALLDAAGPSRRLKAVEAHFDAAPLEARDALLHVRGPPGPLPVRRAGRVAATPRAAGLSRRGSARRRGRPPGWSRSWP